jgi:hypothetical protein
MSSGVKSNLGNLPRTRRPSVAASQNGSSVRP